MLFSSVFKAQTEKEAFCVPELPEVQTIVNDLDRAGLVGRTFTEAKVRWSRIIATSSPGVFCKQISGRTIISIQRRAKLILFELDNSWTLAVHLRMTGRFQMQEAKAPPMPHQHVILSLDDGRSLRYNDTRKFGRFYLADNKDTLLSSYGPEPLDKLFTAAVLTHRLARYHRQIKPLLLDQRFVAGLGNIYADEALWAARIHPMRRSDSLSDKEIKELHSCIRKVLRQGVRHAGTTLGYGQSNFYSLGNTRGGNANHLKVFRRTNLPCPRCRTPISRILVGQRSSHICNKCQKLKPISAILAES